MKKKREMKETFHVLKLRWWKDVIWNLKFFFHKIRVSYLKIENVKIILCTSKFICAFFQKLILFSEPVSFFLSHSIIHEIYCISKKAVTFYLKNCRVGLIFESVESFRKVLKMKSVSWNLKKANLIDKEWVLWPEPIIGF